VSSSGRIRVAIAGIGNCTSSLVQSPVLYGSSDAPTIGLARPDLGGYSVADIDFVAAFEVDGRKVGLDLADAIVAAPNCTTSYVAVPPSGVIVKSAPLLDGLPQHIATSTPLTTEPPVDVAEELRTTGTDVLVCELPGGSAEATAYYAGAALEARVAFINCNPERIANDPAWRQRFADAGVPLLGDDIKSQLGTTVLHRTLLELVERRGFTVDRSYQLNFGGNTDFLNMRDRRRFDTKQNSKLGSISKSISRGGDINLVPPEYIDFLKDEKIAYVRIEATGFLGMKAALEVRLNVEDSPNSSGVVVDAIRVAKVARDRNEGGFLRGVGTAFFKNPPDCIPEVGATAAMDDFLRRAET